MNATDFVDELFHRECFMELVDPNYIGGYDFDEYLPDDLAAWRKKADLELKLAFYNDYDDEIIDELVYGWLFYARDYVDPEVGAEYIENFNAIVEKFGEDRMTNKSKRLDELCKEIGLKIGVSPLIL